MQLKQIIFPRANCAELLEVEAKALAPHEVMVRTEISTVSPGTERANIIGDANVAGRHAPEVKFPRSSGYNSAGVVERVARP